MKERKRSKKVEEVEQQEGWVSLKGREKESKVW